MKIIAKTKDGHTPTFLIEATDQEIARIQGKSYVHSLEKRPEIGQTIEVSIAWDDLLRFRSAKDHIIQAAETLRAVANIAEAASASYVVEPKPEASEP